MPDPMKNMEIEDVLSSIRRLVADEISVRADPLIRKPAAGSGVGKLVLTSALRVGKTDAAPATNDTIPAEAADATGATESVADSTEATDGGSPAATDAADVWEEISLEDRIAELEAAVADSNEDWEPDGSEQVPDAAGFDVAGFGAAEPESVSDEPAVTDARAEGRDAEDVAQGDGTDEKNLFDGDADVVDEAMLRQMVADIVREELQGTLGERITRNVRKLVRREINNALATRDFD